MKKILDNKIYYYIYIFIFLISFVYVDSLSAQYTDYELYQPQNLPKNEAKLNNYKLNLMIARTDFQKAKGLMFYNEIASDTGMLFVYDRPHRMSFWMMNTKIPLDLIFFSENLTVINYIRNMKPGYGKLPSELPHYNSLINAQYALELKAGSIDELNIKIGDKLEIPQILLYSE